MTRHNSLIRALRALEEKFTQWQSDKKELNERLADPAIHTNEHKEQLRALLEREEVLALSISTWERRWWEIQKELSEIL